MDVPDSGGGTTESEDGSPTNAPPGPDETLEELFSVADSPEAKDRNPIDDLEDHELKDAMDSLDQLALDPGHRSAKQYPGIKQWTFATVAVALVASVAFGYLTVRTGSEVAAFAAGLLLGLVALFFGIGSLVSAVLTVQ